MEVVYIFVRPNDNTGMATVSPPNLNKAKLCALSKTARHRLSLQKNGIDKNMLEFRETELNYASATKVLKWVSENSATNPKPMTVEALKIANFYEAIYVYQAAHTLDVDRTARGDSIPNSIRACIKTTTLQLDQFATIVNNLSFDKGLCKSAMNSTMYKVIRGGEQAVPDIDEIRKSTSTRASRRRRSVTRRRRLSASSTHAATVTQAAAELVSRERLQVRIMHGVEM
ncbi:uncharacterized protein LTR77_001980 [Saxophila tyrrhenica]|uniref:Uncharacterized protein n=1 Tax=Saxophila tyrrhenica TaxID=1690608 RepID=A0AAV9PHS7_9PEZI|nr:hypothetical protein LTR77_001980 [Saxophila tyrrhenica]